MAYCDGDAPEAGRSDFDFDFLADLRVRLDAAGVENGDLVVLGNDLFRNDQFGEGLDVAGLRVNGDAQFTGRADRFFGGRQQSFLDSSDEDITADALLPFPKLQNS